MIDQVMKDPLPLMQTLKPQNKDSFDVIVIGAGPAGLSAALCALRADLKVLILEKTLPGGSCSTACEINNYPGFPGGVMGDVLGQKMEDQVIRYGVFYACEEVLDIQQARSTQKGVVTHLGNQYSATTLVLAMGLEPKQLHTHFEDKFLGRGISYYARCDAEAYQGEPVLVVGGGNCACYAAEYLSKVASKVYMVHQHDHLRAVKKLKKRIENNPKIEIMWDTKMSDVFGIDKVEKVKLEHCLNGQYTWIDAKGVFIYIGRKPPKTIVSLELDSDEAGYIVTDEYMRTNIEGIYAAGDIRSKQVRQIATAISDGMISAINIERDVFR